MLDFTKCKFHEVEIFLEGFSVCFFIMWLNSSGLDLLQFVVVSISTGWIAEYFLILMKYMCLDEPSVT
jgi:multisubunit Na+/H+ antiporter MnhB subunit